MAAVPAVLQWEFVAWRAQATYQTLDSTTVTRLVALLQHCWCFSRAVSCLLSLEVDIVQPVRSGVANKTTFLPCLQLRDSQVITLHQLPVTPGIARDCTRPVCPWSLDPCLVDQGCWHLCVYLPAASQCAVWACLCATGVCCTHIGWQLKLNGTACSAGDPPWLGRAALHSASHCVQYPVSLLLPNYYTYSYMACYYAEHGCLRTAAQVRDCLPATCKIPIYYSTALK